MKTSIIKTITVIITAVVLSSCNGNIFNGINGNRNVIIENRNTSEDFTKVKVSSGIDLYLSQGSKNKISVEADENLQDIIITEITNGVLTIYSEKNIWQAKARKVHVVLKNLEVLSASSGADVYAEENFKVNDIKISASSGANIRVSVEANAVETSSNSGADIDISGNTNYHTSEANSGASIDAYNLKSKEATVYVSSGANINIHASENINANANSGGDIDYKGNPKKVSKNSNSGGSISAK